MRKTIDINCDLGEGMGSDKELLQIVSSANIACGAHAGDPETMHAALSTAKACGVAVGAHPGYRDRENFGRVARPLTREALITLVREQIDLLADLAAALNYPLSHVRAHGALGNLTDADPEAARQLLEALEGYPLALMTLGNSAAERAAKERGRPVIRQFFADRAYDSAGQLVSRKLANSVLHDEQLVVSRVLQALNTGTLTSHEGTEFAVAFDSICVHGDTPDALRLAEKIRSAIEQEGIKVVPFTQRQEATTP